LLAIKVIHISEKYKRLSFDKIPPDGFRPLTELSFVPQRKTEQYQQKFNRNPTGISFKCGLLTITATFSPAETPAWVRRPGFAYETPEILRLLDIYIDELVYRWLTDFSVMEPTPPQSEHLALIELALRYCIPAPTIYLLLLKRLLRSWCHAESYLNAVASIFLCAHESMAKCQYTKKEETEMSQVVEFLKQNVPQFVLQHLSKPALYERHGLLPLFVLSAFLIPETDFDEYITQIVGHARTNIIHGVIGAFKPVPSERNYREVVQLLAFRRQSDDADCQGTIPVDNLADVCELLAKRARQIHHFYEATSLPQFLTQWEELEPVFASIAISSVNLFMKLFSEACDQDLFRFILNFKVLYRFLHLPSEYSPFLLFSSIVVNWISQIGERMIHWMTRAVAMDKFEIHHQRDRTSTSLMDMMQIFIQSVQFLRSLQWEDSSINIFVETFLSLCVSTIKMYTEQLTLTMLSYFPIKLIQRFDEEPKLLAPFLPDLRRMGACNVTPAQIFVIINNFMSLRFAWMRYLDTIREAFPEFALHQVFLNPVPQVGHISKRIPVLFAGLTAEQTTAIIGPIVWVKNSGFKKLLVRGASDYILNPLFEQRQSDLFVDLFDKTVADLKLRIDALHSTIATAHHRMMMQGFLHGLDTGLMNVLVFLPEAKPIKRERLLTLLQFFQDVLNDVKEHILERGLEEFTDAVFREFTPLCHYMVANLNGNLTRMMEDDPRDANITLAMCNYLIIASATENRDASKWTKDNRLRYTNRSFLPSFHPRLY
jgi:hypothetical protein